MWGILAAAGGTLAGLVMIATVLPGLMKAWSTGVIISKGHGSPRIDRATEPERFRKLVEARRKPLITGVAVFLVSTFLLGYQVRSIWLITNGYA